MSTPAGGRPNVVYFLVDNLGYGELGCYGGGILRGADTRRIDAFATEGMKLLNFAPEAQCTPSRSALMTGRYAIRSGNHTVALAGTEGGLVAWERTVADILSASGYATACLGKWHIGASRGRWPTDHGFDAWYGIPHTWDECFWPDDPWYDAARDGVSTLLESRKGKDVRSLEQLTLDVRRDIDTEFLARGKDFMKRSVSAGKPFFLYFSHSLMHMPTIPRAEFKGKSGQGDWADCLLELDADFGSILDMLDELGVTDNTVVILRRQWPGRDRAVARSLGLLRGSYFTGMEGSLRTPCLIRYPGRVPGGRQSNEIVHITDMFTTLVRWAGADVPNERVIDGVDQRGFLEGKQASSAREGFPYWMGETLYDKHEPQSRRGDCDRRRDPVRRTQSPGTGAVQGPLCPRLHRAAGLEDRFPARKQVARREERAMPTKFKGVIKTDIRDSKPDWDAFLDTKAPKDAPNVLVILYDDTGCAAWSPYGGRINMPTLDRLAKNGLTYTQWHTTSVCSPTRSCFLTGRNHHQNGFGTIAESAAGFPGYAGHIPPENATIATVLRNAGWTTLWVGKNHNVPVDAFDIGANRKHWPLGLGYDRFYGFIGGETNQWYPS